jgi:hypothetical protein
MLAELRVAPCADDVEALLLPHGVVEASNPAPELFGLRWVLARTNLRRDLGSCTLGDDPIRAEPFDAVELELGALWRG